MTRLRTIGLVCCMLTAAVGAQEPAWNGNVKDCDRPCLVGVIDAYMSALFKKDPKAVPPLARDIRMTENTGEIEVGEGVLWRSRVEPTTFTIYVADPVQGQVAVQVRLKVQGRDTLAAIRLKVDRGKISEIEHLQAGNIAPQAIELLTTPRPVVAEDVPPVQRVSRELMVRVANSYFDALEGDSGMIGAFADDCVRHENGYRTVNKPAARRPHDARATATGPEHPAGQAAPRIQHVDVRPADRLEDVRLHEAHPAAPRPDHRRAETDRRHVSAVRARRHPARAPADAPPSMLQNLVTMETFSMRGGLIHHVEAFPFVTLPYGLGNGWTPGSGR